MLPLENVQTTRLPLDPDSASPGWCWTTAQWIDTFERAVTHAAAADYLSDRERSFRRLDAAGVVTLDVEPQSLAISLVNRYLELKRAGRL